jgi:two-component system, NarL family, nitrate/nitrite response regulator NarL
MSTPAPTPVRLMLVDDHPLVRDGLRARLSAVPGFSVVAEAGSAEEALQEATTALPDLVLMDISMRGANGIEATRRLLAAQPQLRVLMLSMLDTPEAMRSAMAAGACGYLLKDCPADEIVAAIRAAMQGQTLVPQGLMPASDSIDPSTPPLSPVLTPRERDVLALIAEGLSSRDIGERLSMGVRTVETHRMHLRRKLGAPSAAALVLLAAERRWQR